MAGVYVLMVLFPLLAPIVIPIYGGVQLIHKYLLKRIDAAVTLVTIGVGLLAVGIYLKCPVTPLEAVRAFAARLPGIGGALAPASVTWREWLISDPKTICAVLLIETLLGNIVRHGTPEKLLIRHAQRKERRKQRIVKDIDYIPKKNQLVFGVSGSGKSAFFSFSVLEILRKDPSAFVVLVDGKGSTEKYSLYDNLKCISQKTGRRLVILNGTANEALGGAVYDFLDGVTSPQVAKDMIMALIEDATVQESSGSEHYRILTEAYMTKVISFMLAHGIAVTLSNVIQLMRPEAMESVMDDMDVSARDKAEMGDYQKAHWQDVQASVVKLEMFLDGEGDRIFRRHDDTQEVFNIRTAYERGDIVLVLADEMSMPGLVQGLVKLVTMDIRSLTAGRLTGSIDMDKRVYAYFDEFTSYTAALPLMRALFSRARSGEVVVTLATQSASDIIGIPGDWFESLVNTADRFVFFRQHGVESPEAVAGIIGTEYSVTATSRSSQALLTGEKSYTPGKEFILHPDVIRNLPTNIGILFDKKDNQVKFFKNRFVERSD